MFNLADIIAVAIIVLLAGWGMKKGFVRSVFALGSLLLSLILALTLHPVVTDFLDGSVVEEYVHTNVYKVFEAKAQEEAEPTEEPKQALSLPLFFSETIENKTEEVTKNITETVAASVTDLALDLIGILIVFVLVRFILWLALHLLDIIAKLPILHSANKLLGGILGAIYGILAVYLILALLTLFTTFQAFNKPTELVLESKIASQMYHQNIILSFLE